MRIGIAFIKYPTILICLFFLTTHIKLLYGHGGGLNRQGCHNVKRTGGYHCHRSSYTPPAPKKRTPVYVPPQKKSISLVRVPDPVTKLPIEINPATRQSNNLVNSVGLLSNSISKNPIKSKYTSESNVLEVQRYLIYFGFNIGTADGIMGPRTRASIQAYQRTRRLSVNGEPSSSLLNSMALEIGQRAKSATVKSDIKHENPVSKLTERIQFYLGVLELYNGPKDGKMNVELEHSIMKFQNSNRISVDGLVSKNLLSKVKSKLYGH